MSLPADAAILFVLHDFLPQAVAGTEIHVLRLARALSSRRPVVVFHTVRDAARPQHALEYDRIDGIPVIRVVQNYPYRPLRDSLRDPALERIFVAQLERIGPALVHFHHLAFLPLSLPSIAADRGLATVFTLHDYHLACPSGGQLVAHPDRQRCTGPRADRCGPCHAAWGQREGGLEALALRLGQLPVLPPDLAFRAYRRLPSSLKAVLKRLNRPLAAPPGDGEAVDARWRQVGQLFREVDRFVTPSRDLGERFVAWGLPRDRLVHLPNPAPPGLSPAPLPPRPLRLLFLGTLAPHKGLERVVEAMGALEPGTAELEVCGDVDAFPAYVAPIRRRAGPSVRFSGPCPQGEVAAKLASSHVLVLGSRWPENAPLTVIEAHASGRPVVVPGIGGLSELVRHGVDGLIYDTDVPGDLPAALRRLVDEPGLVGHLAAGIRPPPDADEHAAAMEQIYTDAVAARKAGHPAARPRAPF